ncbi:sensor histidine kinase [Nocardioides sp. GXZ039]|uniref:sensor histidine kinase n=1 Tax=Nocardioides sp. GXZ039 TaxID=3136018 RepID=UPI0030F3A5CD
MPHASLTPVFIGLRTGLHLLVAALLALVAFRIAVGEASPTWAAVALVTLFGVVYVAGAWWARTTSTGERRARAGAIWLAVLTVLWVALMATTPEAAYLVFPMFFLYLHLIAPPWGPVAVVLATGIAIIALGMHSGFTAGGVIGPLVGAAVALLIGLGYRALAREAIEREELVAELVATRDQLAATEHEQGILAERARLAREIHDTVAQGMSSVQMLLHAAERSDPEGPGLAHVRLARETAADVLAETRQFIRELSPPGLDKGLPSALRRLAETQAAMNGLQIEVSARDGVELPMPVQTALLRVAQGALANVVQHAGATQVVIALTDDGAHTTLSVADDGVGFDPAAVRAASPSDSFGLRAIRERIAQIGGTVEVESEPGAGTTLAVTVDRSAP